MATLGTDPAFLAPFLFSFELVLVKIPVKSSQGFKSKRNKCKVLFTPPGKGSTFCI